jgi:hypothetical protein
LYDFYDISLVREIAMAKRKGKADAVAAAPSRERSLNWHEDQSKFMLEWCIEYLKNST